MSSVAIKKIDSKKLLTGIFSLSILAHLSLSFVYISSQPKITVNNGAGEAHKLLIKLRKKSRKAKQIVETEQTKNINKTVEANYLGKAVTSFDRETRVENTGTFKSAGRGSRTARDSRSVKNKSNKKVVSLKDIKLSDIGMKPFDLYQKDMRKQDRISLTKKGIKSGSKNNQGLGQRSDFLEDIPLGDFTKLNTQEFKFYGFYHRIREKLEQFWGTNIKEQATKISKQGRHIASNANLITGLVITLNAQGEIVGINLKSTSGVKELDDAAVESFNQAGPFPNPPKGMIKNGVATIDWGFVVNT